MKDIQKARNNLSVEGDAISDYRNAAGLRKPMSLLYHCISCDRPVDISMRGVMSGPTQNFPAKKSLGPYTSFELDSVCVLLFYVWVTFGDAFCYLFQNSWKLK